MRTRLRLSPTLAAAVLCSVLFSAGAADAKPAPPAANEKIVGGTLATRAWPAQGYLRLVASSGAYVCGGTLVSGRWFLTAGHCATNDNGAVLAPSAFTISLGKADLSDFASTDRYTVGTVIRHASYDESPDPTFDVALLRVSSATPPPQEPLGIVSASETALWAPGVTATVIGWGTTCSGCATSTLLREATVPMVSDATCGSLLSYGLAFSAATMVCAGTADRDTCQGDSGGPLMVPRQGDFAVAGITSWGYGCADAQYPGVYTRIGAAALNQWIRDRIPTAAIAISPASPQPGETVQLTATDAKPASQSATATYSWDLDGDCAFDDATGATASIPSGAAGLVLRARRGGVSGRRSRAGPRARDRRQPAGAAGTGSLRAAVAAPSASAATASATARRASAAGAARRAAAAAGDRRAATGRRPAAPARAAAAGPDRRLAAQRPDRQPARPPREGPRRLHGGVQHRGQAAPERCRRAHGRPERGPRRRHRDRRRAVRDGQDRERDDDALTTDRDPAAQGARRHADGGRRRDRRQGPPGVRAHAGDQALSAGPPRAPRAALRAAPQRPRKARCGAKKVDRAPSIETRPPGAFVCDGSGSGAPAAHVGDRLRLLPSGPDLIHRPTPRGTRAISTTAGGLTPKAAPLERGFGLAIADYERQGTADSPPSTVRRRV